MNNLSYVHTCIIKRNESNTRIRLSNPRAVQCPEIHNPTKCLESCLLANCLPSFTDVKTAVSKCLGRAPSLKAKSCMRVDISSSPSSMSALITRPAPLTMANDGCLKTNKGEIVF